MNTVMNYESIFERYGGIMRTCELTREGISYQVLQNLIEQGRVEKIKYGYYQWQDEKAFTEVSVITALFPKAIICDMSAAMYYGYTDRVPGVWHIAVDNKSARNKFKLDFPIIKPHFIETSRLNIGVSEGNIDGITVKIYDRERIVCDCLRHVNTMDGEVFNTVIQRYIGDKKKDAAKLMMYASKLEWRRKQEGWLEYGCKRDKRYGCICAHQIKETGKRNRNQLSDLSSAFCTGRVSS